MQVQSGRSGSSPPVNSLDRQPRVRRRPTNPPTSVPGAVAGVDHTERCHQLRLDWAVPPGSPPAVVWTPPGRWGARRGRCSSGGARIFVVRQSPYHRAPRVLAWFRTVPPTPAARLVDHRKNTSPPPPALYAEGNQRVSRRDVLASGRDRRSPVKSSNEQQRVPTAKEQCRHPASSVVKTSMSRPSPRWNGAGAAVLVAHPGSGRATGCRHESSASQIVGRHADVVRGGGQNGVGFRRLTSAAF